MRVFVAKETFIGALDGVQITVSKGDTAREGHPILAAYPDHFLPQKVRFEHLERPKAAARKPAK